MSACFDTTVSGFNEYVQTLKKKAGVSFTLTRFNSSKIETPYVCAPIKDVKELDDYFPCGLTPLYDAIGKTILAIDRSIQKRSDNPAVIVIVMTDGQENSSVEFGGIQVRDMIKTREAAGWDFVYLGADHDSWQQSSGLGFSRANTMSYDKNDTTATMRGLGASTMSYVGAVADGKAINRNNLGFGRKKTKA